MIEDKVHSVESDEQIVSRLAKDRLTKAAADEVMNVVNDMMFDPKLFAEKLAENHRTLQQGFTRIVVAWIEYLAELKDGQYDGRNDASVRLAKAIVATPEWGSRKYLPYI